MKQWMGCDEEARERYLAALAGKFSDKQKGSAKVEEEINLNPPPPV